MAFNKITDSDLQGLGVTGLPDVPGLDSAEMQKKLDELALYAIERLNLLIDELAAGSAAENIGVGQEPLQRVVDRFSEAIGAAAKKDTVLPKDNTETYTPKDPYNPATKKYVDDKVVAIGAGDMAKSVYDADSDGIVDDAQKLGGHAPEHYAAAEALALHSGSAENPHAVTKAQVGLDKVNNNSIGMALEGTTLTITYS